MNIRIEHVERITIACPLAEYEAAQAYCADNGYAMKSHENRQNDVQVLIAERPLMEDSNPLGEAELEAILGSEADE